MMEFLVYSGVVLFSVCVGYILGIAGGYREKDVSCPRPYYLGMSEKVQYSPPDEDEKIVDFS